MTCFTAMTCFLLLLPAWRLSTDTPAELAELYRPAVETICRVTRNPVEQAYLTAQMWHETKLARPVVEGRCHDMPRGERCDAGRAWGEWQVHHDCEAAWDKTATLEQRRDAAARCSLRQFRYGYWHCRSYAGGFEANSGHVPSCNERWARERLPLFWRALSALRKGSP